MLNNYNIQNIKYSPFATFLMTRWMSVPDGPDTTLIKQRNKTTKKAI